MPNELNVIERGCVNRSFQNADDLHFSPSCSMVVSLHDHIPSLVVFCKMYLCLIISNLREPHIGTVKSRQSIGCNHVNTDDSHFFSSCSMVVTLRDRITSLVVFCNMYLCLVISDLRAPHRHGEIMVTTWLQLSIEMFFLAIQVQ